MLVAVSGGADSTALLAALASLASELGLTLTAAHLHHGLRGTDADADQTSVRELCERLRIPLIALRINARARMARAGTSGEAGLRLLRRHFLLGAAKRARCAYIATAHTADDQLETLLMRIARGTALAGLGGMRARHGAWLKPLLGATRADIEHDLRRAAIPWREDTSNASHEYLRNRIRHEVVPALARALAPGRDIATTRVTLARHALASAADAADCWRVVRARAKVALAAASDARMPLRLDLRVLSRRRGAAVRRAAVRLWWKRANPASTGLQRHALEALLARLAHPTATATIALAGGWMAVARGGWLGLIAPGRPPAGAGPTPTRKRRPHSAILRASKSSSSTRPSSSPTARFRAADHA